MTRVKTCGQVRPRRGLGGARCGSAWCGVVWCGEGGEVRPGCGTAHARAALASLPGLYLACPGARGPRNYPARVIDARYRSGLHNQ